MSRLGFVTGLQIEADQLRKAARRFHLPEIPPIAVSGARPAQAYDGAVQLAKQYGVGHIVSFGIAGGLHPDLQTGDIIVANTILNTFGDSFPGTAPWLERLQRHIGGIVRSGVVLGDDRVAASIFKKAEFHERYLADVIDMESHMAARAARERGVPVTAVRVVADPADFGIPPSALHGVGPNGERRPFAVMRLALKNPREIPALIELGQVSNAAMRQLRKAAEILLDPNPVD